MTAGTSSSALNSQGTPASVASAGWNDQSIAMGSPTAPSYDGSLGQAAINTLTSNPSQSATQLAQSGNDVASIIPKELSLDENNIFNGADRAKWENYYKTQYLDPAIAQTQSDLYSGGRGNSTFGAAALGQAIAQGAYSQQQAGEDMYNSRFNQGMQKRNSFFQNEMGVAQNANTAKQAWANSLANTQQQEGQAKNNFAANMFGQTNAARQAGQNAAWGRQTDIWGRQNDLFNQANTNRTYNTEQNGAKWGAGAQAAEGGFGLASRLF